MGENKKILRRIIEVTFKKRHEIRSIKYADDM